MPTLTLTRDTLVPESFTGVVLHVWPLKVTATTDDLELPPEIFVLYARNIADLDESVFNSISTVPQLSELTTAPQVDGESVIPYYRTDTVEIHCATPEQAETAWIKMQQFVADLIANWNIANNLTGQEIVELAI